MRFTRYITPLMFIGTVLTAPVSAPAADNKEMQSLQRDVADLQDQLKQLQKSLDTKLGALQATAQQAQDTATKTNTNLNNLNSGLMQTVQSSLRGLSDQLAGVAGLSAKVGGIADDVANVEGTLKDLQQTVNKQGQMLSDILNQVKMIQTPAVAPPPGPDSAGIAPGAASGPPPTGQSLFSHAASDQDAGKFDLALTEFKEFLRLYPNDGNAIGAQYNIGNIYYTQGKLPEAVAAFDAAIEQYPKNDLTTPSAYYMKGMALKKDKKNTSAIASFKAVVQQFPHSEEAPQAAQQLRSMGVAAAAPARKPGH